MTGQSACDRLEQLADRLREDRREPDKVLCHVLDVRRLANEMRGTSSSEGGPAPDDAAAVVGRMVIVILANRQTSRDVPWRAYVDKVRAIDLLASDLATEWYERYNYPGIDDVGEDEDPLSVLRIRHVSAWEAKRLEILKELESALNYLLSSPCYRVEYNVRWGQNDRVCWIEASSEEEARGDERDLPTVQREYGGTRTKVRVLSVRRATVDDLEEFVSYGYDAPWNLPPSHATK